MTNLVGLLNFAKANAISMPKRVLLIGGPSMGKSTLIEALKEKGHPCMPEISREVTKAAQQQGVEQLFLTEPLLFSELLLRARIKQFEQALTFDAPFVFIDRGIPDTVAYMDYIGQSYTQEFTTACKTYIYDAVYLLPPWEEIHTTDSERYEDFEHAKALHHALLSTYQAYGYKPIEVPKASVPQRSAFILDHLEHICKTH